VLNVAKIPIVMDTDKEAIALGIKVSNRTNTSNARVVRIKNTLNIHEIMVSKSIYQEVKDKRDFEIIGFLKKMKFNESGVIFYLNSEGEKYEGNLFESTEGYKD